MTKPAEKQVEVTIGEEVSAFVTGASKVEMDGASVSVSKDFKTAIMNGMKIEQTAHGFVFTMTPANDKAPRHAKKDSELVPGQMMPDGRIFIGRWTPNDRNDRPLGKQFNVFAAEGDLPPKHIEALAGYQGEWYWSSTSSSDRKQDHSNHPVRLVRQEGPR